MAVLIASIPFMANGRTRFVHFFLLPMIQLGLLSSLGGELAPNQSGWVARNTIFMTGALMVISVFSASFTYDRRLGIDREVLVRSPYSLYFWGGKACMSMLLGGLLMAINLILLALFGNLSLRGLDIIIVPFLLLAGLSVATLTTLAAWQEKNPYVYTAIIHYFGMILGGVFIDISLYPPPLRWIASFFPFAYLLRWLDRHEAGLLLFSSMISFAWLLASVVIYRHQVTSVKKDPPKWLD